MTDRIKIQIRDLGFQYRNTPILENVRMDIREKTITSITGPSGQGKSTFLMTLNRLWQDIEGTRVTGQINIDFGKGFLCNLF